MTPEERETAKQAFKEKNERRKQGKTEWTRGQRAEARQLRKVTDGAFSNMKNSHYNDRLPGTTGAMRALKKDDD